MQKSINRVSKRALALLLSTIIVLSALFVGGTFNAGAVDNAFETGSKLYLKPNSDWLAHDAKFAAYFYNSENGGSQNEWVNMTQVANDTGAWEVTVPAAYTYDRVNFARFAPDATVAWNNQWNQTIDQGKAEGNMCVITDDKDANWNYTPYWKNYINLASNTYVYFDNSGTRWTNGKTFLLIATDTNVYSSSSISTAINNTFGSTGSTKRLLYRNVTGGSSDFADLNNHWSDVNFIICVQSQGSSSSPTLSKGTYAYDEIFNQDGSISEEKISNSSAKYYGNLVTSSNNSVVFIPDTDLQVINNGTNYANFEQNIQITTDGALTSNGNAVSASYYKLTAVSTVSNQTSLPVSACHLTNVTLTATADTGYHFVGWYSDSELINQVSAENPYSYSVNGATTLYAKFAQGDPLPVYTQTAIAYTVDGGDGGTASVSAAGVEEGSSVNFVAVPNPKYRFDGWFTTSDCSGSAVSTDDPYTIDSVSCANTLYAKFSEIEIEDEEGDTTGEESNKNTARRDVNATSLSEQAKIYYTEEVKDKITDAKVYQTFADLADNQNNSGVDSYAAAEGAPDGNDLYTTLFDIMKDTHTHAVSYPAYGNNSLAHYWLTTDTSYANKDDNREVYTFFYSDVDCFNHEDMQREHIWPKSKASYLMATGLGGSDLHHLRPAYGKVNNIKSNWGFADINNDNGSFKSGWKNKKTVMWPASGKNAKISLWRADDSKGETFADYNTDVHGDIARILLYIYTRWKQPNLYSDIFDEEGNPDTTRLPELDPDDSKDTGERIIYDLPTLLKWMREDPVSEWEMRRNDLTQDIQGNRNVFIDYPELAWLLFDETVPSDMDTPSGMARHQNDFSYDIDKDADVNISDPVTITLDTSLNNGVAEITAYDYNRGKTVYDGDVVERGDVITYTIKPKQSTIANIIEFNSDSNSSGNAYRHTIVEPDTDTQYSFSRQAGYFNGSANTGYDKERLRVTLNSNACQLILKSKSTTAAGTNAGGSGAGIISARYADGVNKNKLIASGEIVPNDTNVIITFTPDYGSRFVTASAASGIDMTSLQQISGTDSYQVTVNLNCIKVTEKDGKTTTTYNSRKKTITATFAQTFNSNDKVTDTESVEYNKARHIYNNGMRPDADDEWGDETNFFTNFEICGAQVKTDSSNFSNKALRFVSVIDKKILDKAEAYGYVLGYTNLNLDTKLINKYAYSLVYNGAGNTTLDCTGSDNNIYGDYGKYSTNKNYKYITASVNNIQNGGNIGLNTVIIARPYVKLKPEYIAVGAPSVIYGQYVDMSTGENYLACSGSWNYINSLAG